MDEHEMDEVFENARRFARYLLSKECGKWSVEATVLVNDAYIRIRPWAAKQSLSRAEYQAALATATRKTLLDHIRQRSAPIHGGHLVRVDFEEGFDLVLSADKPELLDLLALEQALDTVMRQNKLQAELIVLRFYGGLTEAEVAEILGRSVRWVQAEWADARKTLRRLLGGPGEDDGVGRSVPPPV